MGIVKEGCFGFEDEVNGSGAVFSVPYKDLDYNVFLANPDLDKILNVGTGLGKVLNIELPNGDLPLYTWAKEVDKDQDAGWDVMMDVQIASASHVYEHRGILTVVGAESDFGWGEKDWWKVSYEEPPPLKEPQPGDHFTRILLLKQLGQKVACNGRGFIPIRSKSIDS